MRKLAFIIPLCLALMIILSYGCVEEFHPRTNIQERGMIVVDGNINNGLMTVYLSKSIGIGDTFWVEDYHIKDATVEVESSLGATVQGRHMGEGCYQIDMGELDEGAEYRLTFTTGGKHYASSFMPCLKSNPIDSLSYTQQGFDGDVNVRLTTRGEEDPSEEDYYLWSYREDWEVTAELFADASFGKYIGNGIHEIRRHTKDDNIYYCWGKDSSNTLIIGSTEELSDHVIRGKTIKSIPSDNDRISCLYHIQVYQMRISKAGYIYRKQMLDNVEKAGGIFSPIFGVSLGGNITCLDDPTERVIGYVDVGNVVTKDIYISSDDVIYNQPSWDCTIYNLDPNASKNWVDVVGYYWLHYDTNEYVKDGQCVDCRIREKASKDKPAWWPTTHI